MHRCPICIHVLICTGEEEEQVVTAMDGTLFEFDTPESKWRERGKGELRINFNKAQDSTRLIMRQVGIGCMAGAFLYPLVRMVAELSKEFFRFPLCFKSLSR